MIRFSPLLAAALAAAALAPIARAQDTTAVLRADTAAYVAPAPASRLAPLGEAMRQVTDGGRFVNLADGTWWEVDGSDRTGSDIWAAPAFIEVRTNPAPRRTAGAVYDMLLVNGAERRTVLARFVGFERPVREFGGE